MIPNEFLDFLKVYLPIFKKNLSDLSDELIEKHQKTS